MSVTVNYSTYSIQICRNICPFTRNRSNSWITLPIFHYFLDFISLRKNTRLEWSKYCWQNSAGKQSHMHSFPFVHSLISIHSFISIHSHSFISIHSFIIFVLLVSYLPVDSLSISCRVPAWVNCKHNNK
jgi:hypothetical protein